MTVSADNQIEVASTLFGPGQTWENVTWPDFWAENPKTADLPLLGHGSYLGRTFKDVVTVAWTAQTRSSSQSTLRSRKTSLASAWDQSDGEIHWQEGSVHYMLEGQTRRLSFIDKDRPFGLLRVTLEFVANPSPVVVP